MQDIVSKILRIVIWTCCAIWLETEQMPFSQTGRRFRSAALHRIRFGTWGFVPMPYIYSETNESSKDWAQRRALLWSVTNSRQLHRKFISHEKNLSSITRQGPKSPKCAGGGPWRIESDYSYCMVGYNSAVPLLWFFWMSSLLENWIP